MSPVLTLLVAFILAVAVEGGVEALFGTPFNYIQKIKPYKEVILLYIGLAGGVFVALFYQADLIASLASWAQDGSLQVTKVGCILSGLVIGRGSKAVHDFIMTIYARKTAAQAEATVKHAEMVMTVPERLQ